MRTHRLHALAMLAVLIVAIGGGTTGCTLGCATGLASGVLVADGNDLAVRDGPRRDGPDRVQTDGRRAVAPVHRPARSEGEALAP